MTDIRDDGLIEITSGEMSAGVSPLGAELQYLRDSAGRDLLWDGDPAFWTGRAPILFPIVGGLAGNRYRLDGSRYELARHGFARRSRFVVIEQSATTVTFRLEADERTRAMYPFAFRLDIQFAITGAGIRIAATVSNRGDTPMPASFGFHPALRWPLPFGESRADHHVVFAEAEPASIRRLDAAGLVDPVPRPTPVNDRTLALDDSLFADDAIIFDRLASRSLRYGATAGPTLSITFADMPILGIWGKPGAGFVCIEPWQGIADPAGFTGDILAKPAMLVIEPKTSHDFSMTIALDRP